MCSTEKPQANFVADALFDDAIVPLADTRRDSGEQPFFPLTGRSGETTYFQPPILRLMQPADFEFPGGGSAEGLIDALAAYWQGEGESVLAALAPRLKELAAELKKEASEGDGSVSVLCYTMF